MDYYDEIHFRSKDGIHNVAMESRLENILCSSAGRTDDFIIERLYLSYGERDALSLSIE